VFKYSLRKQYSLCYRKERFSTAIIIYPYCKAPNGFIVLVGFMELPASLIAAYQRRSSTFTRPLPKYGGKGMYGAHVHEAVIASGEKEAASAFTWMNCTTTVSTFRPAAEENDTPDRCAEDP
jgi:phosphoribosylglycinamide formyltransferase-1